MLAVQRDLFKPDKATKRLLSVLAIASNSLYNCAVYWNRSAYFELNTFCSYPDLYSLLKQDINYKILHSQVGQQTLKSVSEAFNGFWGLVKAYKKGKLAERPRLPGYRKKGGLFQIVYPGQALKIKEYSSGHRYIRVPLGRAGKDFFSVSNQRCLKDFYLPLPTRLHNVPIRELRIIPKNNQWYIEYVYESIEQVPQFEKKHVLGIDPGIDNLLAGVCTSGNSFLVKGKRLKALNQWYNKSKAVLQSGTDKFLGFSGYQSKRMQRLTEKRNRQMRDAINKAARQVINFCVTNQVKVVVFGWNTGNKSKINIGSANNQNFVCIPTVKLKERIKQLCELYGIEFIETEESYTSKTSFLDQDFLPKIGEKPDGWEPSGKRVKRGLYRTGQGFLVNADLNGSANILRKVITSSNLFELVDRGCLTQPIRIYV